ncbi:hypothetical protein GCM10010252_72780 [Streptomyces aureoverticillatus]|nr:hypothetical protein GCM10010252_72780 [Streptomyces aureoverticillatus]
MPPMPELPPPPQKQNPSNKVIIGAAAAVIIAIVGTGAAVINSRDDGKDMSGTTATKTTPAENVVTAAEEEPEPAAEDDTAGDAVALTDTVTYENDVEVALSKFTRGTSGEYASPKNTPYVKFAVKITNGSGKTVDTTALTVNCSYGKAGQGSESIFDDGLNGSPSTKLLNGRSISVPWACELPRGEKLLQIEVSPDFETETAIFTGDVK